MELAQGAAQTGVDPVAAIDLATLPTDPLAPDSMTPEQFTESRVQAAAEWRAAQEPEYQALVQREQEAVRQREARADTLGKEENSRRFAAAWMEFLPGKHLNAATLRLAVRRISIRSMA